MPDGIHASMDAMQALLPDTFGNRPSTEPDRHQLPASNHAMLALRKLRDGLVVSTLPRPNRFFCTYAMHNFRFAVHCRIVAALV
jgi:hypothetical protein